MVRRLVPWLLVAAVTHAGDLPTRLEMHDIALPVRVIDTPSGLRIVSEYDRSARRAAVVVVVDAGAADDPPGQEGLAHLVEHLGFRSRPDGKHPFTDLLDLAGAGSWNAFTEHDLTTYYSSGATAALPALLRLEAARALDPLHGVDAALFDVEREVVRNELRQRNEQGQVGSVDTELAAALYPAGHRYARPVIGTDASLAKLTLEQAQAFVHERYVPHRMTLVVAGNIPPDQLGKLLDENLPRSLLEDAPAGVKGQAPRIAGARPVPDLPSGPRVRRISVPGDAPSLVIGWSLPQGFGKDGYVEQFAAIVLGAFSTFGFKDDDILDIRASLERERFGSTLVLTVLLSSGKNPERAMESVLDEVYRTWAQSEQPWNTAELAREHQFRLNHLERFAAVDLARNTESLLERNLSRARFTHLTGDATYLRSELAAITSLGAGEISSFAHRWLNRDRARAIYVEPQGTTDPAGGPVPFVFSSSIQRVSVPADALERYIVGPGATTTSFKLSNGLEVVLAARGAAPIVAVTLVSRGGRADAEPLGSAELAQLSTSVRDTRDAFGGSIGVFSSRWTERGSRVFQAEAANGNLENALAMIARTAESLHGFSTPNVGFHFWEKDRLVKIFALPREKAEREIRQAVYGATTLGRVADPAKLEELPGGAWDSWSERTLTPKNSVLVVSGDLDPLQAEGAVRRQLEGWKRAGEALGALPPPPGDDRESPRIRKSARPGSKLTEIALACATPVTSENDLAALKVLGEDLRTRLHQIARTSLGASYGFGARVLLERGVGELRVIGDVDDRGLVRVLAVARHEAGQLGVGPLPPERFELARWRQGLQATAGLEHADSLGRAIARYRLSGLPADTADRYPATLVRLTPQDVARVASLCRRTAVVQVLGEPSTVDRAVQSSGGG